MTGEPMFIWVFCDKAKVPETKYKTLK